MDSSMLSIAVLSWGLLAYLAIDHWSNGPQDRHKALRNTQE